MDNKKLIILLSSIVGVIVVLLVVVWLMSVFSDKKFTYEEVEEKIITAADSYYKNNPTLLPSNDGDYTLSYQTLVDNNYIKPLKDLLVDGESCTVSITVYIYNNSRTFIPYLNCPGNYETKELSDILTQDVVTYGNGLYKGDDGSYYYRGDVDNNYILLGVRNNGKKEEKIYGRIMAINSDGTIRVRLSNKTEETYVWDNRYNETKKTNYGYNIFEKSRLKDTLKKLESSDSTSTDSTLISDKIKSKLVKKQLCIGIRTSDDESKDGSTECATLSEDYYLYGLLTPYEYMRASLDENCKTLNNASCANYNYLAGSSQGSEWMLTVTDKNNYKAYSFGGSSISLSNASNAKRLRFIIDLNKHVFYKSGTGKNTDPYIIK